MKRTTKALLDEYSNVQNGYVGLLSYRLVNLCIKADPVSLLGVTVEVEGMTMNLEDVAMVGEGEDEYKINVYPKDEHNMLLIGKGIAEEHVEFKQEMDVLTTEDGTEYRYIKLTMPEVDEKRKKFMEDAVKVLHDDCVAKLKASNAVYTAKLTAELAGATKENMEEAKKQFEKTTEDNKKTCEDTVSEKRQEIEEAYQQWVERRQQESEQRAEAEDAEGKEAKSSISIKDKTIND